MAPPNVCCNPFNGDKHKIIYKGILKVTKDWNVIFKNFIGQYLCNTCRIKIKKQNNLISLPKPTKQEVSDPELSDIEMSSGSELDDSDGKIPCLSYFSKYNRKQLSLIYRGILKYHK